jgi:hypothetical protein
MAQRDDFVIAGVDPSELDGSLIGLGAAVREEALRDLSRSDLRDLFRQRDDSFVRKESGSVLQLVNLRLDL